MTDINALLSHIQKKLSVPKNRRNSFGNYNYRNCEDIVEAVKAIMPEGCALVLSDDVVMIGDRFYVKSTAAFCFGEKSVQVSAFAREALDRKGMDPAMCTGASSSYSRKYALNGLFAIDDSDDIDSKDNREAEKKSVNAASGKDTKLQVDYVSLFQGFHNTKDKTQAYSAWENISADAKQEFWSKLPPDTQKWIKEILKEVTDARAKKQNYGMA